MKDNLTIFYSMVVCLTQTPRGSKQTLRRNEVRRCGCEESTQTSQKRSFTTQRLTRRVGGPKGMLGLRRFSNRRE